MEDELKQHQTNSMEANELTKEANEGFKDKVAIIDLLQNYLNKLESEIRAMKTAPTNDEEIRDDNVRLRQILDNTEKKIKKEKESFDKEILALRKEKLEALERIRCKTLENEKLKETERVLMNMMKKYVDGDKDSVGSYDKVDKLPYKCDKCQFEANSSNLLREQMLEKHNNGGNKKM